MAQGFVTIRRSMINGSRRFTFSGVINHDICRQPRLLLNNVSLGLRLQPNKNEFVLVSNINPEASPPPPPPDFKYQITDISYDVCFIRPNSSVLLSQDKVLNDNRRALYPYLQSVVKTYNIPGDSLSFTCDDLWSSYVPCDVFCCLIDSQAYAGDYALYPYILENCGVTRFGLFVDGQSAPYKPYETSFVKEHWNLGSYIDAFMGLLGDNPSQCTISYQEFGENYTVFRFPLERYTDTTYPRAKRGHTRMEISFKKALDKNYTLVTYALFPALLQIDSSRNLYLVQ